MDSTKKVTKHVYKACEGKRRTKNDMTVTQEITDSISENYKTLPAFELGLFNYCWKRHYSLVRNELLKCRWREYNNTFNDRVFSPFEFVDNRDFHFYKGNAGYHPAQSLHRNTKFRYRMKLGPGFDDKGQLPIPQESLMNRNVQEKMERKVLRQGDGAAPTPKLEVKFAK